MNAEPDEQKNSDSKETPFEEWYTEHNMDLVFFNILAKERLVLASERLLVENPILIPGTEEVYISQIGVRLDLMKQEVVNNVGNMMVTIELSYDDISFSIRQTFEVYPGKTIKLKDVIGAVASEKNLPNISLFEVKTSNKDEGIIIGPITDSAFIEADVSDIWTESWSEKTLDEPLDKGIMEDNRLVMLRERESLRLIDSPKYLCHDPKIVLISLSVDLIEIKKDPNANGFEQAQIRVNILIKSKVGTLFQQVIMSVIDRTVVSINDLIPNLTLGGYEVPNKVLFQVLDVDAITGVMFGPNLPEEL